ncbi:tripartite tricarboxylate transporter permease [Thalassobaculum sp. OXR-137]|uniref:tripartite tricarboxylate transporter permease n=1 Tax=Thalassobaculum sp. OXR-137 TaxID=3100173 RepID=UPI002AC98962|nr:tripartite tricarboxylate transporter permease [Thalassobaculum sp. OXR-137]WPZ32746.1 tripartite tricarboxylate transporter permease [Thalassobaculum sp. OXR-137]
MDILLNALAAQMQPAVLLTLVCCVVAGMIIGAIPGLTVSIAVALAVPIAIFMPTEIALAMLVSLYGAGVYGGSVSAILLSAPGTPASAATVFDGFPMARAGMATKALRISLIASTFGSVFSIVLLITVAPVLANFALRFGPVEMASILLFTFTIIGTISGPSMTKGLFSAAVGMVLATVGSDPMIGTPRFTYGMTELLDGLTYIPLLVGLFALAEVIEQAVGGFKQDVQRIEVGGEDREKNRIRLADIRQIAMPMVRGSLIGSFIGLLPGIGSTIAAFLAYADSKRAAGKSGRFGEGDIRGIAAPESSNNAVGGATFIPTLALGIPGDAVTAILLGAMVMLGVTPGPLLFVTNPDVVYTIYIVLCMSTLLMLLIGLVATRPLSLVLRLPKVYLLPLVSLTCVAGSYVVRNNFIDVIVMLLAGVLGFLFNRAKIPVTPLLISFIITPPFEEAVRQALTASEGSLTVFVTNPVSLGCLAAALLVVILVIRSRTVRGVITQE